MLPVLYREQMKFVISLQQWDFAQLEKQLQIIPLAVLELINLLSALPEEKETQLSLPLIFFCVLGHMLSEQMICIAAGQFH